MQVYSETTPIVFNGAYSCARMHRLYEIAQLIMINSATLLGLKLAFANML